MLLDRLGDELFMDLLAEHNRLVRPEAGEIGPVTMITRRPAHFPSQEDASVSVAPVWVAPDCRFGTITGSVARTACRRPLASRAKCKPGRRSCRPGY